MGASRSLGCSPPTARSLKPANGQNPSTSPSKRGSPDRLRPALPALRFSFKMDQQQMPASQHVNPKSDIEISQSAKKRPILDIARGRLGVGPEHLEPYGHYKAKVSMDYIKSLKGRPDGKLILVSAI